MLRSHGTEFTRSFARAASFLTHQRRPQPGVIEIAEECASLTSSSSNASEQADHDAEDTSGIGMAKVVFSAQLMWFVASSATQLGSNDAQVHAGHAERSARGHTERHTQLSVCAKAAGVWHTLWTGV